MAPHPRIRAGTLAGIGLPKYVKTAVSELLIDMVEISLSPLLTAFLAGWVMASSGFFPLRGRGADVFYFVQGYDTWALSPYLALRKESRQSKGLAKVLCRRKEGNVPHILFFSYHCKDYVFYTEENFVSFYSPFISKCYNKLLLNLLQLKMDRYVFHTKIQKSDLTTT